MGQVMPVEAKQIRSFGLIVGGIFAAIGIWPLVIRGEAVHLWALAVSGGLALPAVIYPPCLKPIYQGWMYLGAALGWFNTRVILAIGYFLVFTPIAWVMALMGKDPLRRKLDSTERTYRILREPRPGQHMERQF